MNRDFTNYNDDDEVVRQGKDNRARRPTVPSLSSLSTSDGDEDMGIVDRIEAVKKGRRLTVFSLAPDVELRSSKRQGKKRQEESLSVRNIHTRADRWLRSFGVPELLQFEANSTLLQQDWSQLLRIAKYMDEPIINLIKHEANRIPDFNQILRCRTMLCPGTQLLTNDHI